MKRIKGGLTGLIVLGFAFVWGLIIPIGDWFRGTPADAEPDPHAEHLGIGS